jgi:uncharacterized iron-regulated protein
MNDEQIELLKRLYELKEQGILTEEEFSREKQKILAENNVGIQQVEKKKHYEASTYESSTGYLVPIILLIILIICYFYVWGGS